MGRGVYRNYYKGHMEKIKREGGGFGWGGGKVVGGYTQATVIEQQ